MIAYLDTQVVVWLCENRIQKLTKKAIGAIEDADVVISPIVLLELEYLYEIQRIIQPPQVLLTQLEKQIGLAVSEHPFPEVVQAALYETWTRDPFDRLIVAHARSDAYAPLITSDEKIREHYPRCVW